MVGSLLPAVPTSPRCLNASIWVERAPPAYVLASGILVWAVADWFDRLSSAA